MGRLITDITHTHLFTEKDTRPENHTRTLPPLDFTDNPLEMKSSLATMISLELVPRHHAFCLIRTVNVVNTVMSNP
jgi:hypothetical protein